MNCGKCGVENNEEAKFCTMCGQQIISTQVHLENDHAASSGEITSTHRASSIWKYRYAIIGMLVLLSVAMLWFGKSKPDFQKGLAAYQRNDYAGALNEWQPIAEQGDANTQLNVGLMYYNGEGANKDLSKAAYWFAKAAEQGVAQAQYNIGLMYIKGDGVVRDNERGFYWIDKAVKSGNEDAIKFINIFR